MLLYVLLNGFLPFQDDHIPALYDLVKVNIAWHMVQLMADILTGRSLSSARMVVKGQH